MGSSVFPDGVYDHGSTWMSTNDRVAWERTFTVGTDSQRRMAQAMITASPATSNDEIREKMAYADFGPVVRAVPQPTIDSVLGVGPSPDTGHMYDRSPTDFSGTPAGQMASSTPSFAG